MIGNKSFFISLEDFNGGSVTLGDGNVSHVRSMGSISIPSCPKLDRVLYVEILKANVLNISQICDSNFKVNFS